MWIGGVPNTASLADGRKFLRASSHDLVVVREIAGAERAGIDGKLLEIIYVFLTIFLYLLKCPQSLIL